jgi:hypothetical protein
MRGSGRGETDVRTCSALRRLGFVPCLFIAAVIVGCSAGSTHTSSASPTLSNSLSVSPTELPPLRLPISSPGLCAAGQAHTVASGVSPVLGSGPLYPAHLGNNDGILRVSRLVDSVWLGEKVLWIAPPSFSGRAVVRGGRLDGTGDVGFDTGYPAAAIPASQLVLDTSSAGHPAGEWYNWTTYSRVKGPGCYAYQIDGDGFSYTIVFEARLATP